MYYNYNMFVKTTNRDYKACVNDFLKLTANPIQTADIEAVAEARCPKHEAKAHLMSSTIFFDDGVDRFYTAYYNAYVHEHNYEQAIKL